MQLYVHIYEANVLKDPDKVLITGKEALFSLKEATLVILRLILGQVIQLSKKITGVSCNIHIWDLPQKEEEKEDMKGNIH